MHRRLRSSFRLAALRRRDRPDPSCCPEVEALAHHGLAQRDRASRGGASEASRPEPSFAGAPARRRQRAGQAQHPAAQGARDEPGYGSAGAEREPARATTRPAPLGAPSTAISAARRCPPRLRSRRARCPRRSAPELVLVDDRDQRAVVEDRPASSATSRSSPAPPSTQSSPDGCRAACRRCCRPARGRCRPRPHVATGGGSGRRRCRPSAWSASPPAASIVSLPASLVSSSRDGPPRIRSSPSPLSNVAGRAGSQRVVTPEPESSRAAAMRRRRSCRRTACSMTRSIEVMRRSRRARRRRPACAGRPTTGAPRLP